MKNKRLHLSFERLPLYANAAAELIRNAVLWDAATDRSKVRRRDEVVARSTVTLFLSVTGALVDCASSIDPANDANKRGYGTLWAHASAVVCRRGTL